MCVHRIVKSPTYGDAKDWQTCAEFRHNAMKIAVDNNLDEFLSEESIDDVVKILEIMGHVILSEG